MAAVTGAGRGIGRAHAELLAARGAAVVVNDLGGSMAGDGHDDTPAADATAAIVAAGGTAVADSSDVATADGARHLIDTAVDAFGRIDIVVNNAGIMVWAGIADLDPDDFARHWAVHVGGTFHTVKAAWPHFVAQGHGRIVNTTSAGMFGLPANTAYAAAKGGVVGFTRSVARAGVDHDIRANCIAPAAWTRMAGPDDRRPPDMEPELVAPMVAALAHESCPVTGEIYAAGAGRFSRIFLASTAGYVHTGGDPTPEDVVAHWDQIDDETGYHVPVDLTAWSQAFLSHQS